MIHLDTNVLVELPRLIAAGHALAARIASAEPVAVSAQVWFEYVCGPISSDEIGACDSVLSGGIIPTGRGIAECGASLFNAIGRKRSHRADCLIAACAIENAADFYTFNARDFQALVPQGLALKALS